MFSLNNALKSFKTHAEFAKGLQRRNPEVSAKALPPVFSKHAHSQAQVKGSSDRDTIAARHEPDNWQKWFDLSRS